MTPPTKFRGGPLTTRKVIQRRLTEIADFDGIVHLRPHEITQQVVEAIEENVVDFDCELELAPSEGRQP